MTAAVYYENTWTVAANDELLVPIQAEYLHVISASQATFGLTIGEDSPGVARPGASFHAPLGKNFESVRVRNKSATDALVVVLGWGKGDFRLQQFKTIPAGTLETEPDASIPANTTALVLAANPNRRKAIVGNPFANAREFRVGDASVGAARGIEIPPGENLYIDATAAIYAYNPDSVAQSISVLEISE